MSRVGRAPVAVPSGVEVSLSDGLVKVSGPKGSLACSVPTPITVRRDDASATLVVERPNDERASRALHGLTRSLVQNMVLGVTEGYSKELEIRGVGYRATALGPNQVELTVGYSHTVVVAAPEGVTFEISSPTRITVRGIDKQKVGQVAADVRKVRKPEPYKGKGIRYVGEVVHHKAGKAGK